MRQEIVPAQTNRHHPRQRRIGKHRHVGLWQRRVGMVPRIQPGCRGTQTGRSGCGVTRPYQEAEIKRTVVWLVRIPQIIPQPFDGIISFAAGFPRRCQRIPGLARIVAALHDAGRQCIRPANRGNGQKQAANKHRKKAFSPHSLLLIVLQNYIFFATTGKCLRDIDAFLRELTHKKCPSATKKQENPPQALRRQKEICIFVKRKNDKQTI